jgi:hypothetical protein
MFFFARLNYLGLLLNNRLRSNFAFLFAAQLNEENYLAPSFHLFDLSYFKMIYRELRRLMLFSNIHIVVFHSLLGSSVLFFVCDFFS